MCPNSIGSVLAKSEGALHFRAVCEQSPLFQPAPAAVLCEVGHGDFIALNEHVLRSVLCCGL
jgi:hypothetical protein